MQTFQVSSLFLSFPVPTAFYPGCGDDLSYLRPLLDAGVRIFIHCDNIGLSNGGFRKNISISLTEPDTEPAIYLDYGLTYRNYLLETIRKLREAGYNPTLYDQGNLFDEIGEIGSLHSRDMHSPPPDFPFFWFGNWQIIKGYIPESKEPFVILMMNADALFTLMCLYENQNPQYVTFGRTSGMPLNQFYRPLHKNSLIYGASMPIVYPTINGPDSIWDGYDHLKGTWVPNASSHDVAENQAPEGKLPAPWALYPDIRELFWILKVKLFQALNLAVPYLTTFPVIHIPMHMPELTPEEQRQNDNLFDTTRAELYARKHKQELGSDMFKMTENNGGGLYAVERWFEHDSMAIICEISIEDGASSGCKRYYLPTTKLIGEEYWKSGAVYESRVVNSNPILTTHSKQPGIVQNLEPILNALNQEITNIADPNRFNIIIQEFLNLKTDLSIYVFPVTHHYRHGLRKVITGFSAIVQFNRADGSRIVEVSYLNDRVSGCIRMYDASNNLTGELYVRMGGQFRYNLFLEPSSSAV